MFAFVFGPRGFLCLTFPEAFRDETSVWQEEIQFQNHEGSSGEFLAWDKMDPCCREVWLTSELVGS